ncbi:hypothetical protein F3K40_37990 [Streptomyces sp. LBUM 1478]|nr:hypothetical protein [Streptomyces sp. LBUM 1478]
MVEVIISEKSSANRSAHAKPMPDALPTPVMIATGRPSALVGFMWCSPSDPWTRDGVNELDVRHSRQLGAPWQ